MGDLLQTNVRWLANQRKLHMAHAVAYERDGNSVEVLATVGATPIDQVDEHGILHRIESRDYLITAEDLVLGGEHTEPKAGDRVREVIGERTHVYQVFATGDEPPWRWSGPDHVTFRIHTKHVGVE